MRLVGAVDKKPSFALLEELAAEGHASHVVSTLEDDVATAVGAAEDWRERIRRAIAKRNSGQKLDRGLKTVTSCLDRALTQLQHRLQVRRQRKP